MLLLVMFFGWADKAEAAEICAASCQQADVQAQVNTANDGDVILMPAGRCNWGANHVSWKDKSISIVGAGIGKTIITVNNQYAFYVSDANKASFRISNMTINGTPSPSWGFICISSYYKDPPAWVYGWRIDNIEFDLGAEAGSAMSILGTNCGVVDNCVFTTSKASANEMMFINCYSYFYETDLIYKGGYSWSLPIDWGTEKALYMEDNIFYAPNITGGAHPFDAGGGARIVFRYNTVTGGGPIFHPNKSGELGAVKYEIYNNKFIAGSYAGYYPFTVQGGGTGVIFDNQWSGFDVVGLNLMERRISTNESLDPLGRCGPSNSIDGYVNGVRTDPDGNGWPCLHQVGRGPNQESMPVYAWYNGIQPDCATTQAECVDTFKLVATGTGIADYIKSTIHSNGEVDFVNSNVTPKTGYTPYKYPHPLRNENSSGDISPAAPGGLLVR